jgi:hypothetical protein
MQYVKKFDLKEFDSSNVKQIELGHDRIYEEYFVLIYFCLVID